MASKNAMSFFKKVECMSMQRRIRSLPIADGDGTELPRRGKCDYGMQHSDVSTAGPCSRPGIPQGPGSYSYDDCRNRRGMA